MRQFRLGVSLVAAALAVGACGSSDLQAVCDGVAAESEVAYGTGEPPFRVYAVTGEDSAYDHYTEASIRSEWRWTDRDQPVHLVLCLDRVEVFSEGLCPFESDGEEWEVEPFSVQYEAVLREAKTAAIIDTTELFAQSDGCPIFSVHKSGAPSPVASYSSKLEGVETFLQPYVMP